MKKREICPKASKGPGAKGTPHPHPHHCRREEREKGQVWGASEERQAAARRGKGGEREAGVKTQGANSRLGSAPAPIFHPTPETSEQGAALKHQEVMNGPPPGGRIDPHLSKSTITAVSSGGGGGGGNTPHSFPVRP